MIKVKGILFSSLIVLGILFSMPFSIYADDSVTITKSNILGCTLLSGDNGGSSIMCIMDDAYVGNMTLTLNVRDTQNSGNVTTQVMFVVNGVYAIGTSQNVYINYISSISSINYQSLKKKTGSWSFPMESLNYVIECAGKGYDITDFYKLGQYEYPMYTVPANSELLNRALTDANGSNPYFICVMWVNKNISSPNSFASYFTVGNGIIDSVESVMNFRYDGINTRIIKVQISRGTGTSNTTLTTSQELLIMPIYNRRSSEMGYETQDFCDLFGLPYSGLDNDSQQSIDNLEDTMTDFNSSANDVIDVETDIGSGFENALQDIPTSFNFSNQFGASFISSAQWVRDQFNSLTLNNPFGSLITFSLILGVGLLILGRRLL